MIVLQNNENITHRKNIKLKKFIVVFSLSFFLVIVISLLIFILNFLLKDAKEIKKIKSFWNEYDYESVYNTSKDFLQNDAFNNTALTYNGYSAFYLALSQLDSSLSQNYIDESINSLRLALHSARKNLKPQIAYMLGKAYFYKNSINSYYYSDLAIKYLTIAKKSGYKAADISEYLGLSYASLGQTMDSIKEFTEALLYRDSDFLLLSIAEQYNKAGLPNVSMQYLFRVIQNSQNEELVLKSRLLLGNIYLDDGKYADAKNEFDEILKLNKNSADAYYSLGLIYEKQGEMVKARAEWRKALKAQVNHPGALAKMSANR